MSTLILSGATVVSDRDHHGQVRRLGVRMSDAADGWSNSANRVSAGAQPTRRPDVAARNRMRQGVRRESEGACGDGVARTLPVYPYRTACLVRDDRVRTRFRHTAHGREPRSGDATRTVPFR